jgi:hypothetical protein
VESYRIRLHKSEEELIATNARIRDLQFKAGDRSVFLPISEATEFEKTISKFIDERS